MPTLLPFILIAIAVFNIVVRSKKQQEVRNKTAVQPGRPTAPAQAPARAPVRTAPAAAPKPHEARPLEAHIHTPVMGIEGEGTEGVDCCHEYMLSSPAEETSAEVAVPGNENISAQTLLQGVIFSEILGRRRPVRRYGGRRA